MTNYVCEKFSGSSLYYCPSNNVKPFNVNHFESYGGFSAGFKLNLRLPVV